MSLTATPRTWVAAEVVTAAEMNAEIRDAVLGLEAGWTAYTPAWTAVTTNPVLNNGTITGAYMLVGKTLHFRIKLVMGSGTTYGSGEYRFSLPPGLTAAETTFYAPMGTGFCRDDSASTKYPRLAGISTSTTVNLADMSGALVTNAAPFTFATSDIIIVSGCCEVA